MKGLRLDIPKLSKMFITTSSSDGQHKLCDRCADNQRMKIEYLKSFDPPNLSDELFAVAADAYSKNIENLFPLCPKCIITVDIAIKSSERLVLSSRLSELLVNSKKKVTLKYVKLFSFLRKFYHFSIWIFYFLVFLSFLEGQKIIISNYLLYGNIIFILPSLYNPSKNSDIRGDGKFVYLFLRILLIGLRFASLVWIMKMSFVVQSIFSLFCLFLDLLVIVVSRNALTDGTIKISKILHKVGKRLQEDHYSSVTHEVKEREPSQEFNSLCSLSLICDEDENKNHSQQMENRKSAHPFLVPQVKKYSQPYQANAFSSSTTKNTWDDERKQPSSSPFSLSKYEASKIASDGFKNYRNSPRPVKGNGSSSGWYIDQAKLKSKFSEDIIFRQNTFSYQEKNSTGLENLFESVSIMDTSFSIGNIVHCGWKGFKNLEYLVKIMTLPTFAYKLIIPEVLWLDHGLTLILLALLVYSFIPPNQSKLIHFKLNYYRVLHTICFIAYLVLRMTFFSNDYVILAIFGFTWKSNFNIEA
jgi:hypothetical protein